MLQRLIRVLTGRSGVANAGALGEQLAAEWLCRQRGYGMVARNWRNPRDLRQEIDLICRDREVLVFVEVKTRAAGALVPGYFAVDRRKKRVLARAIAAYLKRLAKKPPTFRFDVVEVVLGSGDGRSPGGNPPVVRHFENIPLLPKHFQA